jgi:hypothetical protein
MPPRVVLDRNRGGAYLSMLIVGAGLFGIFLFAAHLAAARVIGRQALNGLALAHGYDTASWWTAGIFSAGVERATA